MAKSTLMQLEHGQQYIKTWPLKRELAAIFIEYRIIKATQLGFKVMPMLAAFSIMIQVQMLGVAYLAQSIAVALFMISFPIQGLLWLGKRANTPLPLTMANWYHQIHEKMADSGCHVPLSAKEPRYQELAELLKQAYDKMDRAFTKNMF